MALSRFHLLLLVYGGTLVLLAAFTGANYGVSWDEPFRWKSGDQKLAYYERLFSAEDPLEVMQTAPRDVYPGLYDLPLAAARTRLDADKVILSRIWSSVFAIALAFVPVALTRQLLVPRRRGQGSEDPSALDDWLPIFAGVILLLMPEVNGHLFMNPKDIPFAASYGWGVVALLGVCARLDSLSWARMFGFGLACGLAMATRPPGVALLGYFAVLAGAWVLFAVDRADWRDRFRALRQLALRGAFAALIATALLVAFWPRTHRTLLSPLTSSVEGVNRLTGFAGSKSLLYGGRFLEVGDAPWSYSLWMFAIKQPEWILVLLMMAVAAACMHASGFWRALGRGRVGSWKLMALLLALVFPWGFVLATQTAIHNGFRHMFYLLPLVAVVATLGWRWIWLRIRIVPRWRTGILAVTAACLAFSVFSIVRLYPYQYIYYNALVGGTAGAFGRYESEYWFTAGKEGATALNAIAKAEPKGVVKAYVMGPKSVLEPYITQGVIFVDRLEEATHYVGRSPSEGIGAGKEVHRVERLGIPLLVVVEL